MNKGDLPVHARLPRHRGAGSADRRRCRATKAQLAGAERDVARYTDLVAKNATPTVNLDNAQTQSDVFRAAIKSDQGLLANLTVQISYCTITAPISGRISAAAVKIGNFVRPADTAPLAVINQMAPVYVSFTVPQKLYLTSAGRWPRKSATVEAVGGDRSAQPTARSSMIENTVDPDHRHGDDPRHHAEPG